MKCKYSYTKEVDDLGRHRLYCRIVDTYCPLVRFCKTVGDFINVDTYKDCSYHKKEGEIEIMKRGNYPVRFEKRGKLYVSLGDQVVTVENKFGENYPKEVAIVKVKDEYYIKGYEPKPSRAKKIEKEQNEEKKED